MKKNKKILISILISIVITSFLISLCYFLATFKIIPMAISGSILSIIIFSRFIYECM